ncbi:hypothetical protein E2E30_08865 [Sphingomonas sp. AAP5]|uniref:hypothetical protein n=1 Tax=Sphingomonas sp. AAP5 TaxID=1523415 RepID=UPI00105726C4|nr:hypothetical protein [Sphingomonas sp. AAP5]QBM75873.1 hypothetical protein E2E30_08865 [Sphingomonas sp. AAP5]
MATAAATSGRKTRKAGAGTPTPANYINSNNQEYSLTDYRIQYLSATCGMPHSLATIHAALVFAGGVA